MCFLLFFSDVRKEEEQQKGQRRTRVEEKGRKIWFRKEPDPDGYFLLQLVKKYSWDDDMFLTAEDASSLTVAGK